MASIGKVLRDARLQLGLSQGAVAKQVGMTAPQLSHIELGRSASPEFQTVARIAAVLDLSLDEIAVRSGAPGSARRGKPKGPSLNAIAHAIETLHQMEKAADGVAARAGELAKRLGREVPDLSRKRRP